MEEFKNSEEKLNKEKGIKRGEIRSRRNPKVEVKKIEDLEKIERRKIEQEKTRSARKFVRSLDENREMEIQKEFVDEETKVTRKRRPYIRNAEKSNIEESKSLVVKPENRLREYNSINKIYKKLIIWYLYIF